MRALFAIIILALLGWGGYWFVGSSALDRTWVAWFKARNAQGWRAEYSDLAVAGFPNRFDTTISGIDLRAPGETWSWAAPFVQVLALSYDLRHVIVIWPHDQTVTTPDQTIDVTSRDMRGSVSLASLLNLSLDHSQFVVKAPAVSSDAGWRLAASELRFATRRNAKLPNGMDVALTAFDLAPGGPAVEGIPGVADLPKALSDFRFDLTLGLTGPLDRSALGATPPEIDRLDVNHVKVAWGDMLVQLSGELKVDRAGVPTGVLQLHLRDWRTMLDLLSATGALSAKDRPDVENVLEVLAGRSGDPQEIDLPINFRAGFVAAGMVPIGPAPRVLIR